MIYLKGKDKQKIDFHQFHYLKNDKTNEINIYIQFISQGDEIELGKILLIIQEEI